jgi:hypothetical protein
MPTFPTSGPIHLNLDVSFGDVRVVASERDDATVEIRPRDPARKADVRAAEQVRIDFGDGRLLVKSARQGIGVWARDGAIDVEIAVPAGTRVDGHTGAGDVRGEGAFGDCSLKTGAGAIRLGRTGQLKLVSGAGEISVDEAGGNAVVVTGSGAIRLGDVGGTVVVKSGNGAVLAGDVAGDLRVSTGNGDVTVERSHGTVVIKTANGAIRAGSLQSGAAELRTAFGTIDVGIAEGTAAKLDVKTEFGVVRQDLEPTGAPPNGAATVTVKARTGMGDITIRRAPRATAAAA